ncbi:PREDICTED: somatostatin-like [Chinchilla lanigera]|uniref:somatostatin-like n=1 Tax=Chinchilla lanigera TaxID=34839 RepID=UPI00038EC42E|nr:PREDICTED: somatostatin-like [Chinchilla lanigera]
MLSCRLQCALAAVSIILALDGVTGAPSFPFSSSFSSSSLSLSCPTQELLNNFSAGLNCRPKTTKNVTLEPEDLSQDAEQDEKRLELQRSANSNPTTAPPKRKAGCKNFFWKTLTSC